MHFLIPAASPHGPQCQAAIARLQLPALAALLQRLSPTTQLHGEPEHLSPLHERVQAQALGWQVADGLIPWAAQAAPLSTHARTPTPEAAPKSWAFITPCHWKPHADHVAMADPAQLDLTDAESQAFMQAMHPYFLEDGIQLHWHNSTTWLAQGAVFHRLPTASVDRVRGAPVDRWMPRQPQAQPLRRLQNEMQMLLYTHPLNDARAARGQAAVNAFWVSGTGDMPTLVPSALQAAVPCTVNTTLQAAALRDDAHAWVQAWQLLDSTLLATLCQPHSSGPQANPQANPKIGPQTGLQLTLCGEHSARTFALQRASLYQRLHRRFTAPHPHTLLQTL